MRIWKRAGTAGPRTWSEPVFRGIAGFALGTGVSSSGSNKKRHVLVYSSLQKDIICTDENGACTDAIRIRISLMLMYDYGDDDITTATMTMTTTTHTTTMTMSMFLGYCF